MDLLTFAHKGEATAFLESQDFAPAKNRAIVDSPLLSGRYFQNEKCGILITGEGLIDAQRRLTHLLTLLETSRVSVERVVNLGVAGSLSAKAKKGEIYAVRTAYAHNGSQPLFHSTTSQDIPKDFPQLDLVSSFERTLTAAQAESFAPFGQLVDREGHGIGQTAGSFHIPWVSLKVVSDEPLNVRAGEKSSFCEITKESAGEFSEKLFKAYRKTSAMTERNIEDDKVAPFLNRSDLHFTRQMRSQLLDSVNKLHIKWGREELERLYESFFAREDLPQRPKERARELLRFLLRELTPFRSQIEKRAQETLDRWRGELQQKKSPLTHLQLQIDPKLEKEGFGLQVWLEDEEQTKDLGEKLQHLDLSSLVKVQRGELYD